MFEPLKKDQNVFATVQFPGTGNAGISYFEGQEVVIAISPEMDLYQLPAFLDAILDGVTRGNPVKVKILVAGSFLNLNSQHTKNWLKECLKDWNGTYENSDFQNILDKGHKEIGEKWTQQLNSILRRYAFNKNVEIVHTRSLEKEEKYWKETFPHVIELCKEEECLEALNKTAFGFAFREFPRLFDQAVSKQGEEDEQDKEAIAEISSLRKKIAESRKTEAESKEDRKKLIQLMGSFLERIIPGFNAEALKNNMKLTGMMEGGFYWDYLESADTFIYPGKEMPIFSKLRKKKEEETLAKEGSSKWNKLRSEQFLRKKIASWIPVKYQTAATLKALRQAKKEGQNGVGSKFRDVDGNPCKPNGSHSPEGVSDSESDSSTNECTISVNGSGMWEGTFEQCKQFIAALNRRKDYPHALSVLLSLQANDTELEEVVSRFKTNLQLSFTSLVESITTSNFGKSFNLFPAVISLSDDELEDLLTAGGLNRKVSMKARKNSK